MTETKREKSERGKHLAAYVAIVGHPSAEVRCPKCYEGHLFVMAEVQLDELKTEVWIQCSTCLVTETMTVSNRE